jgi:ABC-2 type transport system permease protein
VKNMLGWLGIYGSFMKAAVRSQLAHRSAYWAGIVAQWLSYGATFGTLFIMTRTFKSLAGWAPEEILFLYSVYLLSYAIAASFFFNPCTHLAEKIRTGEFDSALTKPISPFGHEFCMGFNFGYVSHITLSVGVIVFAASRVGLRLDLPGILFCILMFFGAVLVQAALLIFTSAFSFFLISDNPFFGILSTIRDFVNYPLRIYPAAIQIVLTFIIPAAFINFFPAAAILGKDPGLFFPLNPAAATPLAGIVLFVLSVLFWNWALSKYQSTGS